jgi:uncharacterized protein (TIGR03437 family)
MMRSRRLHAAAIAAAAVLLPSVSSAQARYDSVATEVYRIDFEFGMDAVVALSPAATLTRDPAEVLEGAQSLKLEGAGATVALRPDVVRFEPSKIYIVEYRYRAIASNAPWALGVGFSRTGADGQKTFVPLRGPVAPPGTVGTDSRSAQIETASDTFSFFTWGGAVVIDDIRILQQDLLAFAPGPPLVTAGFPRLANYALLSPDAIALINGVNQSDVEDIDARYDLMTGTSFDQTLGAGSWVRRLHQKNPSLRILPYKQAFMAQFDTGIDASGLQQQFNAGLQPLWFMRGPSGQLLSEPTFPQNVQLNHTPFSSTVNGTTANDYTADFLADHVLASGLWAGIHFDQPEWYINPLLGSPAPAVDLDGDGHAESTANVQYAWARGFFDYFSKMSSRLGPSALLFGNAGYIPGNPNVLPMLNGWEGEVISPYPIAPGGDWMTSAPSQWYRLVNNYRMATAYARAPQVVSLEFTGRELGTQTGALTPNGYPQRTTQVESRDYRRMRLGLATALLGNGFYEYDLVDNTTPPLWFDEFAVDSRGVATTAMSGRGYLGQPLGEPQELPYPSQVVFQLDFDGGPVPPGVALGGGTVSTNPAEVISGAGSFVVRQNDIAEGKWLFTSTPALVPGHTYQLFADYKVLDYRPTTFAGLLGIGFRDERGDMPAERSASLFLPDVSGPGQQGTLRAALKASTANAVVVGGLTDTGAVAIDNVRLIDGTGGVWRRDFENGIVLVNPTPDALFVSQSDVAGPRNRTQIRRISGAQVSEWNDGSAVTGGIELPSGDGIVLLAAPLSARLPSAVGTVTVSALDSEATLTWPAVAEYAAGYLIRYGESADALTHGAASGPLGWIHLTDLRPGTTYLARISAHDFAGHEGPAVNVTFTTSGTSTARPHFTLAPESPALAPGGVATLVGDGLADANVSAAGPAFPPTLAGTVVTVNGVTAPLLAAAPDHVSFIVPWEVAGDTAIVGLSRDGVPAPERQAPIVAARPWIFTWPGGDIAIATHEDGTLVSQSSPARAGQVVDVLSAGLGVVLPHPDNGSPSAAAHAQQVSASLTAVVGGAPATVVGAWLLPGTAATYGIRIKLPGTVSGLLPLLITAGAAPANTVSMPVQ